MREGARRGAATALLALALPLAAGSRAVGTVTANITVNPFQLPYWAVPPPQLFPRQPPYQTNPPLKPSAVLPQLLYSASSAWGDTRGVRCASALPLRSGDPGLGAEALGDGCASSYAPRTVQP